MLNEIELSGDRETLIPDIQGSIVASLSSATGILATTGYRAFGQSATTSPGGGKTRAHSAPVAGRHGAGAKPLARCPVIAY